MDEVVLKKVRASERVASVRPSTRQLKTVREVRLGSAWLSWVRKFGGKPRLKSSSVRCVIEFGIVEIGSGE